MSNQVNQKVQIVVTNIRKVRRYRNYSQYDVAKKLGISQNAYSHIEQGLTKLTIERLFQIAVVLDVQVRWLLTVKRPTLHDLSQLTPGL